MEKQVMAADGIVVYELKNFSELTKKFRDDVRAELDKGMFIGIKIADDWLALATPTYGIVNNVLALSNPRPFNVLSRIDRGFWRAMCEGEYREIGGSKLDGGVR